MTGHETVQKLRELEHSGKELQRFAALNEAADLLLSVVGAFRPGDAELLRLIRTGYSGWLESLLTQEDKDMLARLQAAAERLER